MAFSDLLCHMARSPALAVTVLLTLAVLVVNGWTDAPNAIAGVVVSGALPFPAAAALAALCNCAGVLSVTAAAPVARTIYSMARFGGTPRQALCALCAAMTAIVLWAVAAWWLGIPTSESHSLIAGLTGAALAVQGGLDGVNGQEWIKVIYGLVLSLALGFALGWGICKALTIICANMDRRRTNKAFKYAQIFGAAAMSFMHGAQDGQKLLGVFLLGLALAQGQGDAPPGPVPLWLSLLCAAAMSGGTALGGRRIIDRMGRDMVALDPCRALSTDLAGALSLWAATLLGLPVSTTHTRTAALLGVGSAGGTSPDWSVARQVALAWLLTFPCCALLGWAAGRVFLGWL